MVSIQEFSACNRQKLADILPNGSAAVLCAAKPQIRSHDSFYPFCQNRNFYYLTGYEHRSAALLLSKLNDKVSTMLFVVHLTPLEIHWNGFLPQPEDASKMTGIESVYPMNLFLQKLFTVLKQADSIYLDFQPVSPGEALDPTLQFVDTIRKTSPHVAIRRIQHFMGLLRQIKTPEEIRRISHAVEHTWNGLDRVVRHIKPGIAEFELEAHFNFELHINRSRPAFETIVAAGRNSTVLHYSTLNSHLRDEDLILLDLGAEYQHYSADISRTFPVSGRFSEKQRLLYDLVLEANIQTIEAVRPGVPFSTLNDTSKHILAKGLKELGYIDSVDHVGKYFTHGVAHSLGMDAHDIVSADFKTLLPGMVITVEPGLYIPEEDVGIRIEDDILVTETGYTNLSKAIPKHSGDIEHWMTGS